MKEATSLFPGVLRTFGSRHNAEERKQFRRERLWRHAYRVAIALVLLGTGFIAGYNVHLRMTPTEPQTSLFTQQIGCVGDWVSGGLYCHGYDAHGNEFALAGILKSRDWAMGNGGKGKMMSSLGTPPGSAVPAFQRNGPLIAVLKQSLWREQERIRRAEAEIINIKLQLLDLGIELPLGE